jgi:hypothetical protein
MFSGFCPVSLFAWIWSGHHEMTTLALSSALTSLALAGKIQRIGATFTHLRFGLRGLWLVDCCQDISLGNAAGLCGVEVPGGQVAHFMRDSRETPSHAYDRCLGHIRDSCIDSWRAFRAAFPNKPVENGGHHNLLRELAGKLHLVEPVHFIKDAIAFLDGQKKLARALHTLQDAFSPAHVLRDSQGRAISDIYTWDDANKHPRPEDGWPGHHTYDNPAYNEVTEVNSGCARDATADVIACVLGSTLEPEVVFRRSLENALERWVARSF